MKKRASTSSSKKKSIPELTSPLSPRPNSSTKFDFSSKKPRMLSPLPGSPANISKTPSKISDLRDLASSRADERKEFLNLCQSEILKEAEGSKTRIEKRFKIQIQACMQLAEELEKDFKKISDRINENSEAVKDSYAKIISGVQASASHVSKVKIPELAQSVEKRIEDLRSRYKIVGTPISFNIHQMQPKKVVKKSGRQTD